MRILHYFEFGFDLIPRIFSLAANPMAWPFPLDFRLCFAYAALVFDPNAHIPRPNRALIYWGACVIAGIRLAREKQVNVRVITTSNAIDESVELAHEIFNRVFRRVPEKVAKLG